MADEPTPGAHSGPVRRCVWIVFLPLGWAMIGLVRLYQIAVSPLLPNMCRFYPSCSQYMIEAIRKRGPIIGVAKGLWRLLRCNPLCRGGYDPVEEDGTADREARTPKPE